MQQCEVIVVGLFQPYLFDLVDHKSYTYILTSGTTLASTVNRPADGQWQRVTLGNGDQTLITRQDDMSHWWSASLAIVTHVTFHVPFTSHGNVRSNSNSITMVGQCLRIRWPSCAMLTDTIGVITLYSISSSLLKTNTRIIIYNLFYFHQWYDDTTTDLSLSQSTIFLKITIVVYQSPLQDILQLGSWSPDRPNNNPYILYNH